LDRAFHLKGLGAVVTGTLVSGAIRTGDTLEVLPRGGTVRVRSIQVHGESREEARAGERTSLQVAGLPLEVLHRGLARATTATFPATTRLAARFTPLDSAPTALQGYVPVRLHLYASEAVGRMRPLGPPETTTIEPGESGLVEIRLAAPVVAVRGDR